MPPTCCLSNLHHCSSITFIRTVPDGTRIGHESRLRLLGGAAAGAPPLDPRQDKRLRGRVARAAARRRLRRGVPELEGDREGDRRAAGGVRTAHVSGSREPARPEGFCCAVFYKEGSVAAELPSLSWSDRRSNFLGTKYTVYHAQPPRAGSMILKTRSFRLGQRQVSPQVPIGDCRIAHIAYESNLLGSRAPRSMRCVMGSVSASATERGRVAPTQTKLPLERLDSFSSIPFLRSKSFDRGNFAGLVTGPEEGVLLLKNKDPRWQEHLHCWCLNFRGRVTVASVKNFQLVAAAENNPEGEICDNVLLQFGKVGKDLFTMDYRYPLSAFQAFAICLSSFDTKVACE